MPTVNIEGVGKVNFPDGMTPEQITQAIETDILPTARPQPKPYAPPNPTDGMSGFDKFAAGMGKAVYDLGRGTGQMLGIVSDEDVAESRRLDRALMDTGAGKAGNVVGTIASAVPAALVPGANTLVGATAIGAGLGALQPTADGESRLTNTAVGGAFGAGGYAVTKAIGTALTNRLSEKIAEKTAEQARNALRDTTLKAAREAGYAVPPSYAGGGKTAMALEAVSGKYKTNQLFGIKNQKITDALARKAVGLADEIPLTPESLQSIRTSAFESGYEPLRNIGAIKTGKAFQNSLDDIVSAYQGASKSFPGAAKNEVKEIVDGLRVKSFDAGDALDMISLLRNDAGKAFRAGDNGLGIALKKSATALEDQIEMRLNQMGTQMVKNGKTANDVLNGYRQARQLIAMAHSVENALEGSGHVDATKLAAQLSKGSPLSGELNLIARFGQLFRDVARVPKSGDANPLTVVDFGFGGLAAGMANPYVAALPVARVGARYMILSKPYQSMAGAPTYTLGALTKLGPKLIDNKGARALSALLSAQEGMSLVNAE